MANLPVEVSPWTSDFGGSSIESRVRPGNSVRKRLKLPFEWQIGWRYTRAGKKSSGNGFISFIALVSMSGIALGVAALIVVLSVMNGFQRDVRDRMLSVLAHVEIFSPTGSMPDWQKTLNEAMRNPQVVAGAPYVDAQALLTRQDSVNGVSLRGVDPSLEGHVSDLAKETTVGSLSDLKPGEFGIVLGSQLAANLAVTVGDKVTLVAPEGSVTPAGMLPRLKQFTVVGVFESGHYEFDSSLAMIHIADAEALFRLPAPTGVRLRLHDMQKAPEVSHQLARSLSGDLYIRDWTKQNETWFSAVQIEKRMMFIILTLIIAVAAFNLVSSLVMTVTDKQPDIAILRTLGAQQRSIMKIFFVQGVTIGFIGTAIGVALGSALAASIPTVVPIIEHALGVQFLPPSIYFINELPSDLELGDVTRIGLMAFVLSALATLYPSWRGSRVRPAEALRYE
ncbi:Lipoprotein-releasing system transmembrane protein LolE [Pararobbsia alpina]|uniref:Lipoprotein-releasing system transmembrane protein LolE n=1 Tax=Pararobbsia alpina TaxID=621374 RepID=A0A6S7B8W1_9BURK|nr:Lipoprotein-releasing system transmembrane protein LolE [Pararobbsia alpina]